MIKLKSVLACKQCSGYQVLCYPYEEAVFKGGVRNISTDGTLHWQGALTGATMLDADYNKIFKGMPCNSCRKMTMIYNDEELLCIV